MPSVDVQALDVNAIRQTMDTMLATASFLAKLTPTQVDDNVIAAVKNLEQQDWFINLVLFVLSKVNANPQLGPAIMAKLAELE